LNVDVQEGQFFVWALINPSLHASISYDFKGVMTGEVFEQEAGGWKYEKSLEQFGIIYHIFYRFTPIEFLTTPSGAV
jgi:hypothetical protein